MKEFQLVIGIIYQPARTLDHLIEEKPIIVCMMIWFVSVTSYLVALTHVSMELSNIVAIPEWHFYLKLIAHPKHFLRIFGVFLLVYIQNLIAVRYYNYSNHYTELLSCNLMILVIKILGSLSAILLAYIGMVPLINYLSAALTLWAAILSVAAIVKAYDTSMKKGILIFVISIVALVTISFLGEYVLA